MRRFYFVIFLLEQHGYSASLRRESWTAVCGKTELIGVDGYIKIPSSNKEIASSAAIDDPVEEANSEVLCGDLILLCPCTVSTSKVPTRSQGADGVEVENSEDETARQRSVFRGMTHISLAD